MYPTITQISQNIGHSDHNGLHIIWQSKCNQFASGSIYLLVYSADTDRNTSVPERGIRTLVVDAEIEYFDLYW